MQENMHALRELRVYASSYARKYASSFARKHDKYDEVLILLGRYALPTLLMAGCYRALCQSRSERH
jgi:hypothetical protein